jgi:formate-dependent nitrite reductase membrane component NrfD
MRFYYLITKPNFGSWVVIGTYILMLYGALATAWFVYSFVTSAAPQTIVFLSASAAVACATYSAFLFAQAKGRDFWQSPLLFWHLLIQAVIAGAASLRLIASATGAHGTLISTLDEITVLSLLVALMMMTIEVTIPAIGEDVRHATDLLIRGRLKFHFLIGAVGIGTLIPALVLSIALNPPFEEPARIAACLLALAGLFIFEDLWVRAGQAPPLS